MAMKVVKKTDEYTIYQRGDQRYAVKDVGKKPVNGDDKIRILVEAGLLDVALSAAPEPEAASAEENVAVAGETAAEEETVAEEEVPEKEAVAKEEAAVEEAPAIEDEASAEEAPADEKEEK